MFDYQALRPTPRMSVSQWAEAHRLLNSRASSEPGRYRLSRVPFWREVMDVLDPLHPCQQVTVMKGAQVGASEMGLSWLGYLMAEATGPAMLVLPTVEQARKFVRQRVEPMIAETDVLLACSSDRLAGNIGSSSTTLKRFAGGSLVILGGNSASALRSNPAKFVMLDEADALPASIQGEGDPLELLRARQRTFASRKLFLLSSPTLAEHSRVEQEFSDGDQRRYHVPCPYCDGMQAIDFDRLRYDPEDIEAGVQLECLHCNQLISEHHKTTLLAAGQWVVTGEANVLHRSYHLSSLYSPSGWATWPDAVRAFQKSRESKAKQAAFVNTWLGETWAERGDAPIWEHLYAGRERFNPQIAPARAIAITAGVDVQGNRLEAVVVAWGPQLEMWCLDYLVMSGSAHDLDSAGSPWAKLDALLARKWPIADSDDTMNIGCACVDAAHASASVYQWWLHRGRANRAHLVRGIHRGQRLVTQSRRPSTQQSGLKNIRLHLVSTHLAKTELYGHLRLPQIGGDPNVVLTGRRHYPIAEWCDEEFFQQLTAESLERVTDRQGYTKERWVKHRRANEVLDCHVYARAAAALLNLEAVTEMPDRQPKPRRKTWSKLR